MHRGFQIESSHELPVAGDLLPLSAAQMEIIEIFSEFAKQIGIPASAGRIYGLLFAASTPLHMNQIKEILDLSLGATSQGLKLLRGMGFIHLAYHTVDRRDHYLPQVDVHVLLGSLLRHKVFPNLADGAQRVARVLEGVGNGGGPSGIVTRLKLLGSWQKVVLGLFSQWERSKSPRKGRTVSRSRK